MELISFKCFAVFILQQLVNCVDDNSAKLTQMSDYAVQLDSLTGLTQATNKYAQCRETCQNAHREAELRLGM